MEQVAQKPLLKEWWFYMIIAVFVIVLYLIWPKSPDTPYSNLDEFATCMTQKGAVMYGTNWCSHCQTQKEMFGKSFNKINFVDCDARASDCTAALVTGYPTWKVLGQSLPGVQSLETLAQASACELIRK